MDTNFKTGLQTISNNLEYQGYQELEQDINLLIDRLSWEFNTPVKSELIKGLEELEADLYNMRKMYDLDRLKAIKPKRKRNKATV